MLFIYSIILLEGPEWIAEVDTDVWHKFLVNAPILSFALWKIADTNSPSNYKPSRFYPAFRGKGRGRNFGNRRLCSQANFATEISIRI